MIRLAGCLTCHSDSFRAIRGCTTCSKTAIQRFRGSDHELNELIELAKTEILAFEARKGQIHSDN